MILLAYSLVFLIKVALFWLAHYILSCIQSIHPCCYQQKPERPSNSFEAFTSEGSPSLLYCTFSPDEPLAFDVQMKSIGQKSLLTRRSFLPRFLPPSFFLENKEIVLKEWYAIFRHFDINRNYEFAKMYIIKSQRQFVCCSNFYESDVKTTKKSLFVFPYKS